MEKEVKFDRFDDYGELMTIDVWCTMVEIGSLIDYDGHGKLATSSEVSDIMVIPSDYGTVYRISGFALNHKFNIPVWATHVVWYNR